MNFMRGTAASSALLLFALSPAQAQEQKKPNLSTEMQQPIIKSISTHNPTPTHLIEASERANDAILQGTSLIKSGHTKDAVAEFQDAVNYTPTNGLAYQRLAEAYVTLGRLDEASQTLHKVLIEGFGPGIGNGVEGSADIWAEYSLILAKTNQPAEAIQTYNHSAYMIDYRDSQYNEGKPSLKVQLPELAAEPTSPEQVQYTPERLQALADTALAHEEMGVGNVKEAVAHMQEAVKLYPDSAVTHYYLGDVLVWPTRRAEAKAAYQKAAEIGDDGTAAAARERLSDLP